MQEKQNRFPVRNSDLVWRSLDEELVIVRPGDGQIRVLNGVGSFVWQSLRSDRNVADLAVLVSAEYEIGAEQAVADINSFLAELDQDQLVDWQG